MRKTIKPLALPSSPRRQGACRSSSKGFTLLELLIVLLLASGLALVCFNALLADGQLVGRMAHRWRQRQERERALDLIRHDLMQGDDVLLNPNQAQHKCSIRGRQPVLVIAIPTDTGKEDDTQTDDTQTDDAKPKNPFKVITYAIGPPPSNVWASRVLLRCGPAFTKKGEWSDGSFLNRVLIDGLQPPETPWQQCPVPKGVEVGSSFALPLSVCMEPDTGLVTIRLSQGQEDSTASAVVGINHFMKVGDLSQEASQKDGQTLE